MINQVHQKAWDTWAQATAPLRAGQLPRQRTRLDDFRRRDKYAIIVLDALRFDYAREVLPQYFAGNLECTWSAAHDTFQYGQRCWSDRVYDGVRYVSGAVPFNSEADADVFDIEHFNELYGDWVPRDHLPGLVDAWRDCWDPGLGTVPPEALTEYARDYTDASKLVVHYFQPHAPYIGTRSLLGHTDSRHAHPNRGNPVDEPVWEGVKTGATTPQELRAAYRANIHRACQAIVPLVEDLLEERAVVIMADHGELLADHGLTSLVSHPRVPHPEIRRVPWLRVEGVHRRPASAGEGDGRSTAAKLEVLGYR